MEQGGTGLFVFSWKGANKVFEDFCGVRASACHPGFSPGLALCCPEGIKGSKPLIWSSMPDSEWPNGKLRLYATASGFDIIRIPYHLAAGSEAAPLLLPQRRRVDRYVKQCNFRRQDPVKDSRNDVRGQGGQGDHAATTVDGNCRRRVAGRRSGVERRVWFKRSQGVRRATDKSGEKRRVNQSNECSIGLNYCPRYHSALT